MIFTTTKSRTFLCKECGRMTYRNDEDKLTNIYYENLCEDCFKNKFKIVKNKRDNINKYGLSNNY